jgi:hypothetical protein
MRRLKRGRLIKIAGVLVIFACVIVGVLAYLPFTPLFSYYSIYRTLSNLDSRGYIKGHPEYCEHIVTDDRSIRLAYTPYAKPEKVNGHQIDPNNWENEPLAFDFMSFQIIVIPLVDYEVTQDGGKSWRGFWQYENGGNFYPQCNSFSSLDTNNFWVWTRSRIAITHDGGDSWIIQDGYKEWNTDGNMVIQKVVFDTPENGQIVFVNWPDTPDPTLLTNDGGKTWHPDPNWTAPTE